jgi:MraZ protein
MFLGEFEYKIDEKGRVPLPPKFRRELKDGVILAPGVEKCIAAYTETEWKNLANTLTSASLSRSKLRRVNRALFAAAFNLTIDGQGRISLPVPLREYAGIEIESEIIIAGVNTYFELWDKAQWQEEKDISQEQTWQIMESLENH